MLAKIRDEKLESRLAADCVEAAKGEKNKSLKNPVKVSPTLVKLAEKYKPTAKPVKPKRLAPAIDLDDKTA